MFLNVHLRRRHIIWWNFATTRALKPIEVCFVLYSSQSTRWWSFWNVYSTSRREMGMIPYRTSVNIGVQVGWFLTSFWSKIVKIPKGLSVQKWTSPSYMKNYELHILEWWYYIMRIRNERLQRENYASVRFRTQKTQYANWKSSYTYIYAYICRHTYIYVY